MKHLALIISLFFTTLLFGQSSTPDSIASRIIEETEKLNTLYELVQGFSADEQSFKVIEYGQPTVELAQNLDDKEKIFQTLIEPINWINPNWSTKLQHPLEFYNVTTEEGDEDP